MCFLGSLLGKCSFSLIIHKFLDETCDILLPDNIPGICKRNYTVTFKIREMILKISNYLSMDPSSRTRVWQIPFLYLRGIWANIIISDDKPFIKRKKLFGDTVSLGREILVKMWTISDREKSFSRIYKFLLKQMMIIFTVYFSLDLGIQSLTHTPPTFCLNGYSISICHNISTENYQPVEPIQFFYTFFVYQASS